MPDKLCWNATFAVKLLLERKDHQHFVDILAYQFDARRPPRPQLRADVVDHWNATLVEFLGETKVEVGKVDEHCDVGTATFCFTNHFAKSAIDAGQMFDDLSQTDH